VRFSFAAIRSGLDFATVAKTADVPAWADLGKEDFHQPLREEADPIQD
jgi:hypothetical protein